MKTAQQLVDESNWSEELKELFWERAGDLEEDDGDIVYIDIHHLMVRTFWWSETPEGFDFWQDVAEGKRTDIDRPRPILGHYHLPHGLHTDKDWEILVRKLLEGLKMEYVSSGVDAFARGFNTAIREMNEKIDEALKKLEI